MAKDVKRRFTVSLDINTKDAEKQIKATVGNLKTILSDMGTASDKMNYFKELADYLSQVDTELDNFKKKHGDGAFNKMFGELDSNLKKEMENVFGVAREQLAQLEQLRTKIGNAKVNGATGDELKALEQEIKNLYDSIGMLDKINLSGRGKLETRIANMENALNDFALVWDSVNSKIKSGFGFSGGSGGGPSSEIQKEIDKLTQQKKELQDTLASLNGTPLKIDIDSKTSIAELERLIQEYQKLQKIMDSTEYRDHSGIYKEKNERDKIYAERIKLANLIQTMNDYMLDGGNNKEAEFATLHMKEIDSAIDYLNDFYDLSKQQTAEIRKMYEDLISDINNKLSQLKASADSVNQDARLNSGRGRGSTGAEGANSGSDSGTGSGSGVGTGATDIDFSKLENTIRSEAQGIINKLGSKIDVNLVNESVGITDAINNLKNTVQEISTNIENYKASQNAGKEQSEVDIMKKNLLHLLDAVNKQNDKLDSSGNKQQQELKAMIMSDGSISVGYGEKGKVTGSTKAMGLLSNLSSQLIADIHSHPIHTFKNGMSYASDMFSGSTGDLNSTGFAKRLGASLTGMITGNILKTLDLSKLTDQQLRLFRQSLSNIEKQYANDPKYNNHIWSENGEFKGFISPKTYEDMHKTSEIFAQMMYDSFKAAGISRDKVDSDIFKQYNLTDDEDLTKLATRLVELASATQQSISPVQRLSEIIQSFGGDVISPHAKTMLKAFEKGEITSADAFNDLVGKYQVNQKTIDSFMHIDYANQLSPIELLLNNISNILNNINGAIRNIEANTSRDINEQIGKNASDLVSVKNGIIPSDLLKNIQSIYDSSNASEYKARDSYSQAMNATNKLYDAINGVFKSGEEPTSDLQHAQKLTDLFKVALSNLQDAVNQVNLYESRNKQALYKNDGVAGTDLTDTLKYELLTHIQKILDPASIQRILDKVYNAKLDVDSEYRKIPHNQDTVNANIDFSNIGDAISNVFSVVQSAQQTLGQILSVLQGFTGIESDNKNAIKYKEPLTGNNVGAFETIEKFNGDLSNLATESTLSKIPVAIEGLAEAIKANNESDASKTDDIHQSLNNLINALNSNIKSLQDVMSGVVEHQKAQKSDTTKAMARIQDPKQRQDILGFARDSVSEYSDNIEIESWQALANGLVKVEGAFKTVNGEWEGFTVKINESNKAVDLAIKKHSSFARFMKQSENRNDNPVKFTPDEVYKNALKYMQEQDEKGNKATLQYQDSGRYTVSVKEQVGGLTKEVFQTFDEFQSKMSRTTVTLSNDISTAIKDSNKLIVDNIDKVGNAGLLQQYNDEYANLIAMNQKYSAMDNLSADDIATWNTQITLVQNLGNEVAKLIKQQDKLDGQSGVATSAKRLQEYQTNADKIFKELDFGLTSENKTPQQQKIVDIYDQIIERINTLKKSHSVLTDAQTQEIDTLVASLKAQADAYQNTLGAGFKSERDLKLSKFDLDKATLQADIAIPDSFNQQITDARSAIENAVDDEGLKIAINNWETLKNRIKEAAVQQDLYIKKTKESSKETKTANEKIAEEVASKQAERNLQKIIGQINVEKNDVGFNFNSKNLTEEQKEIVATYDKLITEIDKYEAAIKHGQQVELDGINKVKDALFTQIDAYKQKYNIEHGGKTGNKKAHGATVVQTATTRYNALKNEASDDRYAGSAVVTQSLERYTAAYERLVNLQSQYKIGQKLTISEEQEFNDAKTACSRYASELDRLLKASKKFDDVSTRINFAGDFVDTDEGRMSAISDTIQQFYDVKVSAENFKDSFTKCVFAVDNGDGTFRQMTATLNAAKNGINVFTSETKQSTSALGKFWDELKGKFRSIGSYLIASFGFHEVIQMVRQGVTYVREIDSALTELKKVTDETDASYDRFLQNMSKTAGVIGSTVAELTTMAAEWARLGYSMADSAKLAESTAILLNVSEFDDATEASEALISTMQAFQYTADESQHVVDILNEVKFTCLLIQ